MACVYILYSYKINKYYTGSCVDFDLRFKEHKENFFSAAFTSKADDWDPVFCICDLKYEQARKIESHIKRMKSKKYIQDLIRYKELSEKLQKLYDK